MARTVSPSQIARNQRMRIAAENGAVVLAEVRSRDVAIRQNMERLRALRLEKEANELPATETSARRRRAAKKTIRVPA